MPRPSVPSALDDVEAFRNGNAYACFGEGFERAATHTFPVVIPGGKLSLFDEVEAFDPAWWTMGQGLYAHPPPCQRGRVVLQGPLP